MKKILLSLAVIALTAGVAGGATYAYFTSQKVLGVNTLAAGTLSIDLTQTGSFSSNEIDVSKMQPGDITGPITVTVRNDGNLNAATFGTFTLSGSLPQDMLIWDYLAVYPEFTDNFITNGTVNNSAILGEYGAKVNLKSWVDGEGALDIPGVPWDMQALKPGQSYTLTFRLKYDPLATVQGRTGGVGYIVKSTQINKEALIGLGIGGNMASAIDSHYTYLVSQVNH